MQRMRIQVLCAALVLGIAASADADDKPARPRLELRNGDRVVLLGNTLVEREQASGYWEAAMTTAFMNADVTFRNLGWSGDTVFAESRGMFDAPAVGYERLIQQLRELKPTVVILGYGGNEAFAGKEGLPRFLVQLKKLIGDVESLGARIVIVSPIAHEAHGKPLPEPAEINAKLAIYVAALEVLSRERRFPFVDLFHLPPPKPPGARWTDNQLHLTKEGYRRTAEALARQLSFPPTDRIFQITYSPPRKRTVGADVSVLSIEKGTLPLLVTGDFVAQADCKLAILGLPDGRHTLEIDKQAVVAATKAEWEAGIPVTNGPDAKQYAELCAAIVEKNRLYFHRWRPQNVTYLFGFRKHEQGQNAKETLEFDALVVEAEAKIAELKYPNSRLYRIVTAQKGN